MSKVVSWVGGFLKGAWGYTLLALALISALALLRREHAKRIWAEARAESLLKQAARALEAFEQEKAKAEKLAASGLRYMQALNKARANFAARKAEIDAKAEASEFDLASKGLAAFWATRLTPEGGIVGHP